ncbi:MAG: hypothetical protein ABW061_10570 [Polyangiaceae bacterium]
MDEDRNWLKNPILPRPPAVPRFSAAELRLVEGERPSGVMRVAARRKRSAPVENQRAARQPLQSGATTVESEAPQSRRIA